MTFSPQNIYNIVPVTVQNILLSSYSIYIHFERYGKKFRQRYKEFTENQWKSYDEMRTYQDVHVKYLIKHVYDNVTYYRNVMDSRKLKPEDIEKVSDLPKLPLLTREDVKNNFNDLISGHLSAFQKKLLVKGHTSGTTGAPLEFYWDTTTCVVNNAADWRQKEMAGIKIFEKCAVILGRTIVPLSQEKPPFWRTNYIHNTLWLSAFHMNRQTLPGYVEQLFKFQPVYIEGYPSTLTILAKYLQSKNIKMPLKAVFSSSETLHPIQRELIEEAFQTKLFDFYGLAERVVFATECDAHEGHHLNMDYGITEIVNNTGEPLPNGELGWMVGTGLHNYAMPLIRYKIMDVSSIQKRTCSCGRSFPLMSDVTTKAEDIISTKSGNFISSSVLTHPFKPLVNIKKSQIIQEDLENVTIKIVKGEQYTEDDTIILLKEMKPRLGNEMNINVEYVDDIPLSSNGKFRWVISRVPLNIK